MLGFEKPIEEEVVALHEIDGASNCKARKRVERPCCCCLTTPPHPSKHFARVLDWAKGGEECQDTSLIKPFSFFSAHPDQRHTSCMQDGCPLAPTTKGAGISIGMDFRRYAGLSFPYYCCPLPCHCCNKPFAPTYELDHYPLSLRTLHYRFLVLFGRESELQ